MDSFAGIEDFNITTTELSLFQIDNGTYMHDEIDNQTFVELSDFSDRDTFLISVTVPILFALIVGIGLVGNILVVIVVGSNAQMKSTTNQLITNLAIADLLFIVFCVPFTAWDYATSYWPFGRAWCKICQYLIAVCAYASIYTLVLMSLDRYLAVAHPIRSMSLRNSKYTHMALAVMWIVIIIVCAPSMWVYNLVDHGDGVWACRFIVDEYSEWVFQLNFFMLSFVIPIAVIMALYVAMLNRLWGNIVPGRNAASKSSENSMRSKRKVTRMVVVVVLIFTICWLPIQFFLLLKSLGFIGMNRSTVILQIFSQIFAYMNSCVNPILYAFLSENFRKGFKRVIARTGRNDGGGQCGTGNRQTALEQELTTNGARKKLNAITTATTTTTTSTHLLDSKPNNGIHCNNSETNGNDHDKNGTNNNNNNSHSSNNNNNNNNLTDTTNQAVTPNTSSIRSPISFNGQLTSTSPTPQSTSVTITSASNGGISEHLVSLSNSHSPHSELRTSAQIPRDTLL